MGAQEQTQYMLRLAQAKCSGGTMENHVNLPLDHGVYAGGQPLLNQEDHVPEEHIIHFGNCRCAKTNMGLKILDKMLNANPLVLLGRAVDHFFLGGAIEAEVTSWFSKCKPQTTELWQNAKEDFLVGSYPALTSESFLTCKYGGVINFVIENEPTPEEAAAQAQAEVDAVNAPD
jgi:hypothetical protein